MASVVLKGCTLEVLRFHVIWNVCVLLSVSAFGAELFYHNIHIQELPALIGANSGSNGSGIESSKFFRAMQVERSADLKLLQV